MKNYAGMAATTIGITAFAFACLAGTSYFAERTVENMNAKTAVRVSESCNRLQAIPGAVVVVRDGTGQNLFGETMPVDAACWAKGSDGQWRQIETIAGPIADLYPKRLVEAMGK